MRRKKAKPFVLVLMPFSEAFESVYKDGIKKACEAAGMHCERIDEQRFDGLILERIYGEITRADLVVCDMTGLNPNVFYETGYAHALGKRAILLIKDDTEIPFDLRQYQHVVYRGDAEALRSDLEERLRAHHSAELVAGRAIASDPSLSISPRTAERQLKGVPKEWGCRSMYLGLDGAKNWLSLAKAPQYHRAAYFREVVTDLLVNDFLKDVVVSALVSLGVGDGATDRILCEHLGKRHWLSYVPVDINPYLVSHAAAAVSPVAHIATCVVCDFEEETQQYLKPQLERVYRGPRLFSLLGYTLCNVDDPEAQFFWSLQELMASGDYLLLDYIAISQDWNDFLYAMRWHQEWDGAMRKLLCDAYARKTGQDASSLLSEFEVRFVFREGRTDVPNARGTYIADSKSGDRVANVRRYRSLRGWLGRSFSFDIVDERFISDGEAAGRGYLLARKT